MNFQEILGALMCEKACRRKGWNGKGMWIRVQRPNEQSKMTLPYIYMRTVQGDLVPWVASHTDILSDDWEIAHD